MGTLAKGLGFFAAGVVAGGVAAALTTPKNGRAMRKAVKKDFQHRKDAAARLARDVAGEFRSAYDSSRDVAGRLASPFRTAS